MDINNSDFPSFIHYVLPEIQENINLECRDLSLEEFVPPMLQVKFTINLWDILELKMETRYGKRIVHLVKSQIRTLCVMWKRSRH